MQLELGALAMPTAGKIEAPVREDAKRCEACGDPLTAFFALSVCSSCLVAKGGNAHRHDSGGSGRPKGVAGHAGYVSNSGMAS